MPQVCRKARMRVPIYEKESEREHARRKAEDDFNLNYIDLVGIRSLAFSQARRGLMSSIARLRLTAVLGASLAIASPALAQSAGGDTPEAQRPQTQADREVALEAQVRALQEQLSAIQAQLQDL